MAKRQVDYLDCKCCLAAYSIHLVFKVELLPNTRHSKILKGDIESFHLDREPSNVAELRRELQ